MKNTIIVILSLFICSCGDIVLGEKIVAENKLETLINYESSIVDATENNALLSITKNIFDKSQQKENCAYPLKIESEFLLFKNQNFEKSTGQFNSTIGLKKEGDFFQKVYETYNSGLKSVVIEKYNLNFEQVDRKVFKITEKIKPEYQYIQFGASIYNGDNENYLAYSTSNNSMLINSKVFISKTVGNNLSPVYEYEFKNYQSSTILGMDYGSDRNLYILTKATNKNESAHIILKFDIVKNEISMEKEVALENISYSRFLKQKDGNFIIYHQQNYLQYPYVYQYSLSSKSVIKKPINFSEIGQEFDYVGNQASYVGEKYLLTATKNLQKTIIAELTDDFKIIPIFINKEINSSNRIVDTATGGLVLYEVSNSWVEKKQEVNFYKHSSLTNVLQKNIFNNHANVKQCFKYD